MADILNENDFLEDEQGPEIVMLDDEPFEIIGDLDHDGETYFALIPYEEEVVDEDEEVEFVILKGTEENGENFLTTVDDDDLYEKLGEMFLKMFAEVI